MSQTPLHERPGNGGRPLGRLVAGSFLLAGLGLGLLPDPGVSPLPAQEGRGLVGRHLLFANTYRTADRDGNRDDFLVLGHYDFLSDRDVRLSYFFYDAKKDLAPITTTKKHNPMNAPYGPPHPDPGFIHIPKYAAFRQFKGTWQRDGRILRVRVGRVVHEWRLEDPAAGYYAMTGPYYDAVTGESVIDGLTYSHGVGHGYAADVAIRKRPISRRQLLDHYDGVLCELQSAGNENTPWSGPTPTQLNTDVFRTAGDPDVWGYSYPAKGPGLAGMWVQETLLLNYAPYSKLLLYLNGGHDFNRNGAQDETGHSTQLLGVLEGGRVTRMVFVQYSYETDGYPILGVGRYYARERPKTRPF